MISCDTNILFPAFNSSSSQHASARLFLERESNNDRFLLCEQVLVELYGLLRNPTICEEPASAKKATSIIQQMRKNSSWRIVDVPQGPDCMNAVWNQAANPSFPYRRIFDVRLATTLRHHGVTEFATCNHRDFKQAGFQKIWNPLT